MNNFHGLVIEVNDFRNARNWKQFHTIKNLLLGLNIEVAELQEIFLWRDEKEIKSIAREEKELIADELADILTFLIYLGTDLNIDLVEAAMNKIQKNSKKYPVDKSYGNNRKYDKL